MSSLPTAGWQNELKVTEDQCGSISNQNAKRILQFLKEGEKRINLSATTLTEVIFLIGNTGSGKTTLANFLTNEDLVSYEVGEESGEFILYRTDEDIEADSTVVSKTTYPRLFVDQKTGVIYIDVGGFNDTGRNEAFDMASAYFLRKQIEKAERIKIVLVSDHSSLRKGVNRYDFMMLLHNVTFLFKNIEKYLDAMALIATKVDNTISDAATIKNIANFLVEVKTSLKNNQNSEQIYSSKLYRAENQAFVEKSAILIDALLKRTDDDAEYSRLGIFRRPDTKGPISRIPVLQDCKAKLKAMLINNLKYVPLNPDDIRYSVSFKTKNILRDLADEIHQNVESDLNQFIKELVAYYEIAISTLSSDKQDLKDYLVASSERLTRIRSIDESSSLKNFLSHIRTNLTDSCKRIVGSFIVDIENLNKFLEFIGKLGSRNFDFCVKKWITSLEAVISFLENALASASETVRQSASTFFEWVKQLVDSFKQKVLNIFRNMIECLNV